MIGTIPFTQYLMPDGRKASVVIDVENDIAALAADIISHGFRFECEVLRTGQVSLTIFDPEEEDDIDIRVVPNGPEVIEAIDSLVREFHQRGMKPE